MKIINLLVTDYAGEATEFRVGKDFSELPDSIVTKIEQNLEHGIVSYSIYFKNGKIFNLDGYQFLSEVVNDD